MCPFPFSNQPVNFLGKTISFTVSDKDQMEVISSAVSKGLAFINKSFYRGVQQSLDSSTLTCASVVPALAHLSDSYISSFTFRTKVSCYILYSSVLPCLLSTKSLTSVMKSAKVPFTSSQIVWSMCLWNKHWFKIWKLESFKCRSLRRE